MAERDGSGVGSARRRRERRLRSWWRHERMTVAAELAVALHHSRGVKPYGDRRLRAQWDGGRCPEGARAASGCGARGLPVLRAPLLAIPCLGGGADGVDVTTTRFLLRKALLRKKEEEEEKRKEEVLQRKRDELVALLDVLPEHRTPDQQSRVQALTREYRASKRKRKKRRKRRLPRTSSLFSPRRRLRQWHLQGWSSWCCSSRCVPVVGICSGMCWLVLLVTLHLALCSSSLLSMSVAIPQVQFLDRLFCLLMKPVAFPQVQLMDKVLCPLLFRLVLLVKQRRKLRIYRSCCSSTCSFWFLSWCRGRFPWSSSSPRCFASWPVWTRRNCPAFARLGLLGFDDVPRAVLLLLSQAQDARHHGWHGPQDSVEVHRCSSWTRSSTCPLLCYVWCYGPDSAVHCLAVPQLQFITVVDTPFRCAVAVPHGPVCSENHRDSPVRIWWSMSLFAGFPQVQSWMDCSDSQLQPLSLGLGVQACKFHRCGL